MMRNSVLAFLIVSLSASLALSSTLNPELVDKLNSSADNELIRFVITMEVQGDFDWLMTATEGLSKSEARELVMAYLQDLTESTQEEVKSYLQSYEPSGKVLGLQSVRIVNVLYGRATPEVLWGLAEFPGIVEVSWDPERYMLPYQRSDKGGHYQPDAVDEIAWGVEDINADDVWAMGYYGTGVIVGVCDTGVNYNHMDLVDHMWDGGAQYPNHGWDFHNNDNDPMDDGSAFMGGHGTHCSGSVASDGTAGSQCGVAPDASIMAIKVLSGNGYGSEGPVLSGIDFAVDQGADIFSMSLGFQSTSQHNQFRTACNNALAAGVVGVIAAGNEGNQPWSYPIPGNIRTPGDVPPPWLHPDQVLTGGTSCVITAGATDISHNLAYFSSLGPVTWESISPWNDYAYSGGSQMGLIDPDVSAPGVNIKSLDFQNIWGYEDGWSGTSMATPHIAGTLALMLHKNPNLTPAELDMYLETTAIDYGATGKDNSYGSGLINALAAVSVIPGGSAPDVEMTITPTGSTALPATGGTLNFDVTLENLETSNTYVTAWLEWTYPDGSSSGALISRNLMLSPAAYLSRSLWMTVSGSEPNGYYTFWARAGSGYGGTVYTEDSFNFSKGMDGNAGQWVPLTQVYGWEDGALEATLPSEYSMAQNYPNPFNPVTMIPFNLPETGYVSLKVFDLQGREVATILEGELAAGHYEVSYNAAHLSSGVYIYSFEAPGFSKSMKMALLK
jgi:serine protease AprX